LDTTWRLSSFIGFILNLCFAGLIAFQTPLVTLVLIRSGAVERAVISSHRRHVWFSAVVLGALLSPPDPLSMLLVAAPMLILFELALLFDRMLSWFKIFQQQSTRGKLSFSPWCWLHCIVNHGLFHVPRTVSFHHGAPSVRLEVQK